MFGYGLLDQRYAGIQTSLMHDGASRIAGHEQNSEPWPPRDGNVRKLPSVQAGHDDVGEKQIDALAGVFDHGPRRFAATGGLNVVVQFGQQFEQGVADAVIVLDDQDRLATALRNFVRAGSCFVAAERERTRQVYFDAGSDRDLAVDLDMA